MALPWIYSGPAPKGAWKAIWGSFCSNMQSVDGESAASATHDNEGDNKQLWQALVSWHKEVRERDRVRLAERYALNLEAASLPQLKTLQPLQPVAL